MEEYFSGGDYYGGGETVERPATVTKLVWSDVLWPGNWNNHCWWVALLVVLVVCVIWYIVLVSTKIMKPDFTKAGFTSKEGLAPGMYAIRDDTGFPNTDSLAEKAKERLVEAGREPNIYHPDPVELATQLALRAGGQATNLNDQETTETAALKTAMAANAAAGAAKFRNRFTERMTPEEEVRAKQAAMAGL